MFSIGWEEIQDAAARIAGVVHETPLAPAPALSAAAGGEVWLKLEHRLWPVGSFKLRGAYNRMARLTAAERARGVLTVSAGNHAQAVAYCAQMLELDAVIYMPTTTPSVKVENTRRFGADVRLEGGDYDASAARAHAFEQASGRVFVHAFCDPAIIAGAGTAALEILRQQPDIDTLVVPVGGGGLAIGCGVAAKSQRGGVRVVGVQPEASAPFHHALRAGRRVDVPIGASLADALVGELISEEFFQLFREWVDDVVTVGEPALERGIYWMLEHHGEVIEGAGAAGIAAILEGRIELRGRKTAVLVTGRGIDFDALLEIIQRHAGA